MFLTDDLKETTDKNFKEKLKELIQKFPKIQTNDKQAKKPTRECQTKEQKEPQNKKPNTRKKTNKTNKTNQKSSKFLQELKAFNKLLKNGQKDYNNLKKLAKKYFEEITMYSEMIELTVPKDRGSMRSRFRKANKNFEKTIKKTNQLVDICQNPYFGRIDFKFSKDTRNPKLRDKTSTFYIGKKGKKIGNRKITDWRAPISSIYYNFPKPTDDCFYKREKEIITGSLKRKRKIDIEDAKLKNVFEGNELTSLVGSDPYLLKQLKKNASSQLKDIISTIQSEQNEIISLEIDKDIIVQGVAGSGKTSIAVHRLSWLLYNYSNIKAQKCLIIAPNRLFLKYIKDLLPEIGAENVPQTTFRQWAKNHLQRILKNEKIYDTDEPSPEKNSIKYMRFIERIARKNKNKNKKTRFNSKDILQIYKNSTQEDKITNDDLAPLLYLKTELNGINPNNMIDYLVVDEAQDHSPSEILILKRFADTGRSLIVGDLLQGIINPTGIQSWQELIETIYDPQKVEFYKIRKSYRSTKSIVQYVNKRLRENNVPNNLLPLAVLRKGEEVQVFNESDIDKILYKIKQICKQNKAKNQKNTAIIVPEKHITLFEGDLKKELDITVLDKNTKYKGGIALGHVRIFKGLEFDSVILVYLPESLDENLETKNFYVACTRAMHSLYVIDMD
jgi:DNA helicase IV